ncbi:hypothetical protein N7510_003103 [Penicillium lagena]|uniref:uncharacterized protein n=1 Tax=Penicillium lagena TaxID=94218 RepID=UPI00253F72D3|nr:uncharacterized protein N7510_003103 [Penicillium lagena]KAJ5619119.1 hypothetical protein N7510_003103 [Penicillium lagena]
MVKFLLLFLSTLPFIGASFGHRGALHTADDFIRMANYVNAKSIPWYTDWKLLLNSTYAQSTYKPQAVSAIYRGSDGIHAENYQLLYEDAAAMYQLANTAEVMRIYPGWSSTDITTFQNMMEDVFAGQNEFFLRTHNGSADIPYANWDLCNMASMLAISILNDNSTKFNWVVDYVYDGWGHGAVGNGTNFIVASYTESGSRKILFQGQEAGRDQGNATLDFTLAGVLTQQMKRFPHIEPITRIT